MHVIPLLSGSAQRGATSVRRARCFQRVASRGELGVFSVLGTFGLFTAVGLLGLFRALGEFGVRGPFCVFHAFGLLSAVDVYRPFGVFGSIGAFGAIGLLGVLNAFSNFAAYSARSACLVPLVRLARLASSARWVYFERSLYSVCPVCVDAGVAVAVDADVGVDVAVGIHDCAAAILTSCVNIGVRVDVCVCFGRLRLCFLDCAVAGERSSRMFTFFKKPKARDRQTQSAPYPFREQRPVAHSLM